MGKVEEGVEALTLGGIESRGSDGGDWWVVCSTKNRAAQWIELGDGKLAELDGSASSIVVRRAAWGAFYRRRR